MYLTNAIPSLNVRQLNLQDGLLDLTNIDWKNLPGNVVDDLNEVRKIGSAFERDLPLDKFTKLLMDVQVGKTSSYFLTFMRWI
jgi:hypothetical protein